MLQIWNASSKSLSTCHQRNTQGFLRPQFRLDVLDICVPIIAFLNVVMVIFITVKQLQKQLLESVNATFIFVTHKRMWWFIIYFAALLVSKMTSLSQVLSIYTHVMVLISKVDTNRLIRGFTTWAVGRRAKNTICASIYVLLAEKNQGYTRLGGGTRVDTIDESG